MIPVDPAYLPVSALEVPRFAGIATVMRLPLRTLNAPGGAEIGFSGCPSTAARRTAPARATRRARCATPPP
jgi:guanidinopropionase